MAKAVGRKDEGHAGGGGGVEIPLRIAHIDGRFQPVALDDQPDVLAFGFACAPDALEIADVFRRAVRGQKRLDVTVRTVAHDEERVCFRKPRERFADLRVQPCAVLCQVCAFVNGAFIEDLEAAGKRQVWKQLFRQFLGAETHHAFKLLAARQAADVGLLCKDRAPRAADLLGGVPERAVQIKNNAVILHEKKSFLYIR